MTNRIDRETAVQLYNRFKEMNDLTLEMYGHDNRVALAGMKKHEWAIKEN